MKKVNRSKQSGLAAVEFTILASVLLLILFAIFEIGIYAFSLQKLNDVSRRAARIATVCVVNDGNIKSLALSEGGIAGLSEDNIEIRYLDSSGANVSDPEGSHVDIHYVSAQIVNFDYSFTVLFNLLDGNGIFRVPEFRTILPAESLGVLKIDSSDKEPCNG